MEVRDFDNWRSFEEFYRELRAEEQKGDTGGGASPLLFRGQGDVTWRLETTLERRAKGSWSLARYYRLASVLKPQIETFTGEEWELEDLKTLRAWTSEYDNPHLLPLPGYEYLLYLRHHSFPSPLLDWTRSPYVAAYFAFENPTSERVAIFVYRERGGVGKSGSSDRPAIFTLGPHVRGHSRHFLQQSQYSYAAIFDTQPNHSEKQWRYVCHEDVFGLEEQDQDLLWKCTIPAKERLFVLSYLDEYNLNAYSLFQNAQSLMETLAVREIERRACDM